VKTTADTVNTRHYLCGKRLPLENLCRTSLVRRATGSKTMKAKEGVISGPNVQKVIETSGKQPGSQLPVTTVPEKKHEVIQEEHVPARSRTGSEPIQ